MHSEAWGDPRDPHDPREHRGGHRMRMRMRGGPGGGPGPWGGGPFEFGMRGGPFGPPRFGGRGPRVRRDSLASSLASISATQLASSALLNRAGISTTTRSPSRYAATWRRRRALRRTSTLA